MRSNILLLLFFCLPFAGWAQKDIVERDLKEILVKPKKQRYKRKGNPAVELMRKVIAAKGNHQLDSNDYVSFYKYQRTTYAIDNITQRDVDSLKVLQKSLWKQQVEFCEQTGKYILPFNYTEKVFHYLWSKNPERRRNILLGENTEGVTDLLTIGDMCTTVLSSVFKDINIYDNTITFVERKITSPISSRGAISFYQYFIEDTLHIDGERFIRLNFVPQNPQDFGFSGRIVIYDDSTYRVRECRLSLPVRSAVNYVSNLIIDQRFTDLPNGQRVLAHDDFFAELGIVKSQRLFSVHRSTTYSNISLDSISDEAFQQKSSLQDFGNETDDSTFWAEHRTDTLSRSENRMKAFVDSLFSKTKRSPWAYIFNAAISNYAVTHANPSKSRVDIGPLMSTVSINFIDGWRVRVGAQTTANLFSHLFLKGYVAYGTKSNHWYGMGQIEYSFNKKKYSPLEYPRHSITAQFREEVVSQQDLTWTQNRDKDNFWVSFKAFEVDHMMFSRHGSLTYEIEVPHNLSYKVEAKVNRLTPTGSLFYRTLAGVDVANIQLSTLSATVRWAPGEEITYTKQRRRMINHNFPVFTLSHTTGFQGVLGGQYTSNITELTISERLWLNSWGRIDFYLRGAAQWNRVPFPVLIMPVANSSYIITRDMFQMIENMEFINDRYASFGVEWDLSGKLLNRIPLLNKLKLREVIGFRMLYGHLTSKNDPFNPDNANDPYLFEFPSRNGECIVHSMSNTPYMELNVGLHNILKIIRIDYVYRINYHFPGTKKHGVRLGFQFNF